MTWKVCMLKSVLTALVLGFCYLDLYLEPYRYTSPWFVAVWGVVTILGVLTRGERDGGLRVTRMQPILQAVLALSLTLTALATSIERGLSGKHWLIQIGWTGVTLVLYRGGLAWAWSQLTGKE